MKKFILAASIVFGALCASAQAVQQPKFTDNWSMGLDGGVITPMSNHAFFGSMRGVVGLHLQKQITPAFAVGAEGKWTVNTSSWSGYHSSTAFDNSYVGVYGAVNLFNLFGGYNCGVRPFDIEAVAGAGWLHGYVNAANGDDYNDFATRVGLNFNFNVSEYLTLSLSPYILWDMTAEGADQSTCAYNVNQAAFALEAGLTYHFGGNKFTCVTPYNQAEVDALNAMVNDLRASRDQAVASSDAWQTKANNLAQELAACNARPVQTVKEVTNNLNSVRYVFFRIGSSVITPDQQPNVEMIAAYLKNHKDAKVQIRGYASPDGSLEFNERLAQARAEAVKNALIKKYKIAADRIDAQGEGIGHMFTEESWNRVSICTIEDAK